MTERQVNLLKERFSGIAYLRKAESQLIQKGKFLELLYSYRSLEAWPEMIELVGDMPPPLSVNPDVQREVREQLGMALNRCGRREEAKQVLLGLIHDGRGRSNTFGILGRVFKDEWEEAEAHHDHMRAESALQSAIETYRNGYVAGPEGVYPGINLLTLTEISGGHDERTDVIRDSLKSTVEERLSTQNPAPDYFVFATLIELAALENEATHASNLLKRATELAREAWEPRTTARNLRLIRKARHAEDRPQNWLFQIEAELEKAARRLLPA